MLWDVTLAEGSLICPKSCDYNATAFSDCRCGCPALDEEAGNAPLNASAAYTFLMAHGILPRYRGGNAMQWQIIDGEPEVGVTIFVPDTGVDTGPVVVQKGGVTIDATDTTGSLFFNKLAPLGVDAIVEAVNLIDTGEASLDVQDESRATHQGLVKDADAAVDLSRAAEEVDRLIRGCDPQPGAWAECEGEAVRFSGSAVVEVDGRGRGAEDARPHERPRPRQRPRPLVGGRVERGQDLPWQVELPQPLLLLARRLGELRPQNIKLRASLQQGQAHLLDLWE